MDEREKKTELTADNNSQPDKTAGMDGDPSPTIINTAEFTAADHIQLGARQRSSEKRTTIDIPGYRILHKLGQGGMGSVYLAIDGKLSRQVAIKVISHAALDSQKSLNRFLGEIQTAASLKHPNIVQLHSAGDKDGIPFFVMEYVDGSTLDQHVGASPLEPRTAAELIRDLAIAIDYCHRQGVVHRDLKPANILMDQQSVPKIADFGLAKAFKDNDSVTKTGEILGTPSYMAPEQASGNAKQIGPATDVYGLGAIFYYVLTGRAPFAAPDTIKTIAQVISDEPVSPRSLQQGVPLDLDTICLKCLAKNPDRRYPSAQAVAEDVQRFLDGEPIHARPIRYWERAIKWTRRRPAWATLIGLVAVAVPLAFAGLAYHSGQLSAALKRESRALADADKELKKSLQLSEQASEVTNWLTGEHTNQLRQLNGAMLIRHGVNEQVRGFLDRSTPYMPKNAKFVRRFGKAYYGLAMSSGGESESSLGETAEAIGLLEQAIELYERALQLDPDDVITKNLKIQALLALGEQHHAMGKIELASSAVDQARQIFDSINDDTSNDRRLLGIFLLEAEYRELQSSQQLSEALVIIDKMESAIESGPEDPLEKEERLHQQLKIARMRSVALRQDGEFESAQEVLERAIPLAEQSYRNSPNHPQVLERYAGILASFADLQTSLGEHESALKLLLQVLELRQTYADNNPHDAFSEYNLASALSRIEGAYYQLGDSEKQLEYASKTVELYRKITENM